MADMRSHSVILRAESGRDHRGGEMADQTGTTSGHRAITGSRVPPSARRMRPDVGFRGSEEELDLEVIRNRGSASNVPCPVNRSIK